jgi:hypothetical protein
MNRADASVGDRVRVASEGWVLAKNAACLLGIPMFGLLSGLTLGILLYRQAVFHWIGVGALAMVAPLLGILLGTRCYRRVSADHHPVVTHILEKEVGAACLPSGPEGSPICQGCAGKPN